MPELPDVEVKRRYLQERVLNKIIDCLEINDARIIRGTDFKDLEKGVVGRRFTSIDRLGKHLILKTDAGGTMLMHFGLTGDAVYQRQDEPLPPFFHAVFYMNDYALYFCDQRKFGKIAFYDTQNLDEIDELRKLGPEPLEETFDYQTFRQIVGRHAGSIHEVLMMQDEMAGVGNIYADEICFQAGVRPNRAPEV